MPSQALDSGPLHRASPSPTPSMFKRSPRGPRRLRQAATLALLAATAGLAQAADVRWAAFGALDSGALAPGIIGAPDGTTVGDPWRAAKFTERTSYATLAGKMGLSESQLASYQVLAWENNGGSPAASGGWESAKWTFDDLTTAVTSTFNELTGAGDNPAVLFKTGSITGAQYNSVFGTHVPDAEVWSWLLVRLPSGVHADSPSFNVKFLPVGGGVGLGEGTPDPDAIGVLAAVPEPSTWALWGCGLLGLAWRRRRALRAALGGTALLLLAQSPAMAVVTIDDFSSGGFIHTQGPLGFGSPSIELQSGSMAGGRRFVAFETDSGLTGSSAESKVAVTTADHRFWMETGEGIAQRTSVLYGYGGVGDVTPLALDLSGQDRIRVDFAFNSAQLNFNILLYNGITPYVQIGVNVLASDHPFSVDFRFADGAYPGGPIDFSHIDMIYLQTQSTQYGQSFVLNSISAVPEPASPAMLCAGMLLLAGVRLHARRGQTQGSPGA